MKFNEKSQHKGPSQRQLQVGEEIRHLLSAIFLRGEMADPVINDASITVSEVRISPDLKNATAYFFPLAGKNKEQALDALNDSANFLRHLMGKSLRLRYTPKLKFKLDESYETAGHIQSLLNTPHVAQDLKQK